MATKNQTFTAYFNYIDCITLTLNIVNACSHSGQCDNDVKMCMQLPEIISQLNKIGSHQLIKELQQYGAWDMDELQDHQANLERILWIAANNIQDEMIIED